MNPLAKILKYILANNFAAFIGIFGFLWLILLAMCKQPFGVPYIFALAGMVIGFILAVYTNYDSPN